MEISPSTRPTVQLMILRILSSRQSSPKVCPTAHVDAKINVMIIRMRIEIPDKDKHMCRISSNRQKS